MEEEKRLSSQQYSLRRLALAVAVGALCLRLFEWFGPIIALPVAGLTSLFVLRPRLFWAIPVAFPFLYFAFVYSISESYCFFNPTIDTRYAGGYSEAAFDRIATGQPAESVRRALGEPMYISTDPNRPSREFWQYTGDGKCSWGDWAWFSRYVIIENGRVVSAEKSIQYD